ncbi:unnamed protein product, partial [Hymenolepis diminuta]
MVFKSSSKFSVGLLKTPSSTTETLTISNGRCQINGEDVGNPCDETEGKYNKEVQHVNKST